MPTGTFRFYEELNEFLPKHRNKVDFEAEFNGRKSIKDIIKISKKENRIILTTHKELKRSKSVTHCILMRPGTTIKQIKYVMEYLDVKPSPI